MLLLFTTSLCFSLSFKIVAAGSTVVTSSLIRFEDVSSPSPAEDSNSNNKTCCLGNLQYNGLYDFYTALGGENWIYLEPLSEYGNKWNFTTTNSSLSCPCSGRWQGITCETMETECMILDISLSNYDLVGTMPESIGNFTSLQKLNIGKNSIHGTIPDSIYNLTQLLWLELFANSMTGSLSPKIGNLIDLKILNIYKNLFTGSIPNVFQNLTDLNTFSPYTNHFTGLIPDSLCMAKDVLLNFYIDTNYFSSSIWKYDNWQYFKQSWQFSGII